MTEGGGGGGGRGMFVCCIDACMRSLPRARSSEAREVFIMTGLCPCFSS